MAYADRILATCEEDWTEVFSTELSELGPEISVETSLVPGPAAFSDDASWAKDFLLGSEGG